MRVLIIDDNELKRADIEREIIACCREPDLAKVDLAGSLSEAVEFTNPIHYDVIVIDLMLPYFPGGKAEVSAGAELLRVIKKEGQINNGAQILGLSAYPDEIVSSRVVFEGKGVLLSQYDESGDWKVMLRNVIRGLPNHKGKKIHVDFVIVVALLEERLGLAQAGIELLSDAIINGLNVKHARWSSDEVVKAGVVVLLRQMGLAVATLETTIILNTFECGVLCMSGICAGFSARVRLGQVLIASPAWEYQAGKWAHDGFLIAPNQIQLRSSTRVQLEKICQGNEVRSELEAGLPNSINRPPQPAEPMLVPFVTGSAVIADPTRLAHIQVQHRQIGGLDMETYGLYLAAHEVADPAVHYFGAKCVVDYADADKADDLHAYGSFVSAKLVTLFFRKIFLR